MMMLLLTEKVRRVGGKVVMGLLGALGGLPRSGPGEGPEGHKRSRPKGRGGYYRWCLRGSGLDGANGDGEVVHTEIDLDGDGR